MTVYEKYKYAFNKTNFIGHGAQLSWLHLHNYITWDERQKLRQLDTNENLDPRENILLVCLIYKILTKSKNDSPR